MPCPLPLYSFLFLRPDTCEDGELGLKSEEDGGGGELATPQNRWPGLGRVMASEGLGLSWAPSGFSHLKSSSVPTQPIDIYSEAD